MERSIFSYLLCVMQKFSISPTLGEAHSTLGWFRLDNLSTLGVGDKLKSDIFCTRKWVGWNQNFDEVPRKNMN